ncbi:hypothetical protein Y032_0026g1347 [Ancylostoma ceylanicum]|uniref:GRAM domain-containing protein n=1 Tax=Ancylostoma ceylanicum TaxID=53326 RepID=A0A016UVC2_9BILA|nr:hypothetical protein Y032_0026g1347 [Ancylostoma ceylanicum]
MDCLSEQSSPISHPRAQWAAANGHLDNFDSAPVPLMNRPRAGISPLAAGAASPSPPQDPPPRERNSMETEEESVAESSSCMSFYSNDDEESVHEDPMIENVLAYRSCVMNDKERTFPKGISSGILYLTESALIYRAKSITDDRAPTIMLFADVISVKKIQSLRTMGLLAGTRKSLEITMEGRKKPLQFIGLAQRDDFFFRIQSVCQRVDARIEFL